MTVGGVQDQQESYEFESQGSMTRSKRQQECDQFNFPISHIQITASKNIANGAAHHAKSAQVLAGKIVSRAQARTHIYRRDSHPSCL